MPENDQNLGWNVDVSDLSSISLDDESLNELDDVLNTDESTNSTGLDSNNSTSTSSEQTSSSIDESVFLESWDIKKNVIKDGENFGSYLRRFFFSAILTLLWLLAIVLFYTFSSYIKEASKPIPDPEKQEYIDKYKEKYKKVKGMIGMDGVYTSPMVWAPDESTKANEIINATDIDYIDKKDLLSQYASDLVRKAEDNAVRAEILKQDIAKQWFLPEELETLLSEDQAIDTIQRSLNALEVIKFSTATKVFSYMNTALATISEMIRVSWASIENLHNLFVQLSSRWEKDISSYVYMCYLNPFEINANCDAIWDLDLYYKIAKDDSIDMRLFKNSMNAISQLLEKEDTSLFSITFNWFNAEDKSIKFNIEVFTNQEDERSLMQQWKRNPNIFILTNIINLLKLSRFVIWAEINIKEVKVDTKTIDQWSISRTVNYSTMDFSVPIQKNTEREIFDYIDLDSLKKLLTERWFTWNLRYAEDELISVENEENTLESEDGEENSLESENEELVDEEINSDELDTELSTWEESTAEEASRSRRTRDLNTEI